MPNQNSTIQPHLEAMRQHGNLGYSDQEWKDALLLALASQAQRDLGAASNSPVARALQKVAQDAWDLAEAMLGQQNQQQGEQQPPAQQPGSTPTA